MKQLNCRVVSDSPYEARLSNNEVHLDASARECGAHLNILSVARKFVINNEISKRVEEVPHDGILPYCLLYIHFCPYLETLM